MRNTLIGLVLVTLGEVAGLVAWLGLTAADRPFAGFAALIAGEALEWAMLAYMILRSPLSHPLKTGRTRAALVQTAIISLAEAALWVGWLYLIPRIGFALATMLLFVTMHIKHDLEIAVFAGRTPLKGFFAIPDVTASAFEVGGAAGWYLLAMSGHEIIGAATLLICISIEHTLQFWTAGFFNPPKSS
jgi:hypothetical protein